MKTKRIVCLLLVCVLLLSAFQALAAPEDYVGKKLPDFTVQTADGGTFTLSEALKKYDLVVVNYWATWCPPCRMEFPFLEEAWQKYKDRVAVIALSVESRDTQLIIAGFAKEFSLTFPMGRDTDDRLAKMGGNGIPTTLLVSSDGTIVSAEVGAKLSVEQFTSWFDQYLPKK